MDKKEIVFKSIPEFWHKESLGLKRNTIRRQNEELDYRFKVLREWMCAKTDLMVGIVNTETGGVFYRKVTDVSKFDGYYIISWWPPASYSN